MLFRRLRGPAFSKAEAKILVDLVEKYKSIVLNKSICSRVNRLKDSAWEKITMAFNKQKIEYVRSTESLKNKWENLKRRAKDNSNDVFQKHITTLMVQSEDNPVVHEKLSESEDEMNEQEIKNSESDTVDPWDLMTEKESANSDGDSENKRRYRGRTFKDEEVKMLLKLIEKYKSMILNRSNSTSVSILKERAWKKIYREFKRCRFQNERSTECLKMKWDNLKRKAKTLTEVKHESADDIISHTISLMAQMKDDPHIAEEMSESEEESDEQDEKNSKDAVIEGNCDEKGSDDSSDEEAESRRRGPVTRSANFSPNECKLLLECVKREKSNIFLKPNTQGSMKIKNRAWERITHAFNKVSPQKRNKKDLRCKFISMKFMNKGKFNRIFRNKHSTLHEEDSPKEIKSEPVFESDIEHEKADDDNHSFTNDKQNEIPIQCPKEDISLENDPLRTVLSSDSGLGWMNPSEDQQVTKLKLELLNYEMETARLKRKRMEDLIKADAAYLEVRQRETCMRLRAARLEAVAAALKLPPLHPALHFTADEAPAQYYLT